VFGVSAIGLLDTINTFTVTAFAVSSAADGVAVLQNAIVVIAFR
jgi:hypothetical protein